MLPDSDVGRRAYVPQRYPALGYTLRCTRPDGRYAMSEAVS